MVGFKITWLEFVVAQYRDAHTISLKHHGRMSFFKVVTRSVISNAILLEQSKHFSKSLRTKITRVVVRQAHSIKILAQVFQTAWVGSKGIGFIRFFRAFGRHNTL